MFAIWMHFKGEYWIIENIVVRTYICGMYPFAKPPIRVDTTYLHLHTYFHNPQRKRVWIVDPWHVQQVEPQTLIMEKIIMEKIIMEKK